MIQRMKDITPSRLDSQQSHPTPAPPKASAISEALRKMVIHARGRRRIWIPSYASTRRWEDSFGTYIFRAFIFVVIAPCLLAGIYLVFFMSDQFASETRFAVRTVERSSFDPISSLIGVPSAGRIQEALIVSEYISGHGIVEELEQKMNLRQKFSGPQVDFVSKFNPNNSIEKLVKYWRWHVDVDISAISGIVKVVVYAFTPQDSLEIARAILASSERLVNEISDRLRKDSLAQSQIELSRAEAALQSKIKALQDLRNSEGLLDAEKTSDVMTQMLGDMRLELIRMNREYNAQRQTLAQDSPQLRVLESRIKATRDQISRLEAQMTSSVQTLTPALADSMARFERLKLEHELAQKRYVAAATAHERARAEATTQLVYLTTFVTPTLAEEALYPRRLWIFTIILVGCIALWGAGTGTAVLVRNHMA